MIHQSLFESASRGLTLVRQAELLHAGHMHFTLALVGKEVLTVAGGPVALICAAGG